MNMHWQDEPRITGRNDTPVQTPLTDKLWTLSSASLEFIERTEEETIVHLVAVSFCLNDFANGTRTARKRSTGTAR